MSLLLLAMIVGLIVMRPMIINLFCNRPSAYRPSRLVELGLLVALLGVWMPFALAERGLVSYDSPSLIAAMAAAIIGGLAAGIWGIGLELRNNR